jgi:hypothetical protein
MSRKATTYQILQLHLIMDKTRASPAAHPTNGTHLVPQSLGEKTVGWGRLYDEFPLGDNGLFESMVLQFLFHPENR